MNKAWRFVALAALAAIGGPASAQVDASCKPHPIDPDIATFFDTLRKGDPLSSLRGSLGKAPMMQGRQTDIETLARQMQTALDVYGPLRGMECVSEQRLGATVIQRRYVSHHDKMMLRWTFIYGKLPSGWTNIQTSYDDLAGNWFD